MGNWVGGSPSSGCSPAGWGCARCARARGRGRHGFGGTALGAGIVARCGRGEVCATARFGAADGSEGPVTSSSAAAERPRDGFTAQCSTDTGGATGLSDSPSHAACALPRAWCHAVGCERQAHRVPSTQEDWPEGVGNQHGRLGRRHVHGRPGSHAPVAAYLAVARVQAREGRAELGLLPRQLC